MQFNLSLNEEQKRAVTHQKENLLVLAGPGSGKTTVLVERIRFLIEFYHIPPNQLLVITFTKAAAQSMEKRFYSFSSNHSYPVSFFTFHSFFYQILKTHYQLHPDCFLSENEKENLLIPILKKFNITEPVQLWLERLKQYLNDDKISPSSEKFYDVFISYKEILNKQNRTDYDLLALQCYDLFHTAESILKEWKCKFPYILIDEFQDINNLQYKVMKQLHDAGSILFAVGDDDQSIYGFRGSKPNLIREFLNDFKPASKIILGKNYRCNKQIVAVSKQVIEHNTNRFNKDLIGVNMSENGSVNFYSFLNSKEEYMFLSQKIMEYERGTDSSNIAIIVRTNALVAEIMKQLNSYNIFCIKKEKQESLWNYFIVKDIIAYLLFAKKEKKRTYFFQIKEKPSRGLLRDFFSEEYIDFDKILFLYKDQEIMYNKIIKFQNEIETIEKLPLFLAINYIRKKVGYDLYLRNKAKKEGDDFNFYNKIMNELQCKSRDYKNLDDFIYDLKLEWSQKYHLENSNKIQILTMHMAKGLEFERVILPDCNEGIIPKGKNLSQNEIEEERRLFYVAMTRAKKSLDILYLNEKDYPRKISQFITEFL